MVSKAAALPTDVVETVDGRAPTETVTRAVPTKVLLPGPVTPVEFETRPKSVELPGGIAVVVKVRTDDLARTMTAVGEKAAALPSMRKNSL